MAHAKTLAESAEGISGILAAAPFEFPLQKFPTLNFDHCVHGRKLAELGCRKQDF
jgi:hypothetical protein